MRILILIILLFVFSFQALAGNTDFDKLIQRLDGYWMKTELTYKDSTYKYTSTDTNYYFWQLMSFRKDTFEAGINCIENEGIYPSFYIQPWLYVKAWDFFPEGMLGGSTEGAEVVVLEEISESKYIVCYSDFSGNHKMTMILTTNSITFEEKSKPYNNTYPFSEKYKRIKVPDFITQQIKR